MVDDSKRQLLNYSCPPFHSHAVGLVPLDQFALLVSLKTQPFSLRIQLFRTAEDSYRSSSSLAVSSSLFVR